MVGGKLHGGTLNVGGDGTDSLQFIDRLMQKRRSGFDERFSNFQRA